MSSIFQFKKLFKKTFLLEIPSLYFYLIQMNANFGFVCTEMTILVLPTWNSGFS